MALTPSEHIGGGTLGTPEVIGTFTVSGTTYTKYRLAVDMGTITYDASHQHKVNHNISSLNPQNVLSLTIMISNASMSIAAPYIGSTGSISSWITSTQIVLVSSAEILSGNHAQAVVEYYK